MSAGLDPADEPVGVERTVATRTDVIAVSGRIDRLDARPRADGADGTELVVVDYKTGRHVLSVDDARSSLALALYAIAASRTLHRDCQQVELHHLPSGQVLAWTHTAESLARHLRRAEGIAEECAAADERMRAPLPAASYDEVFPPKPSPGCGWCDYQRLCPEGQQAATPRRPWDALAELLRRQLAHFPTSSRPVPITLARAQPHRRPGTSRDTHAPPRHRRARRPALITWHPHQLGWDKYAAHDTQTVDAAGADSWLQ